MKKILVILCVILFLGAVLYFSIFIKVNPILGTVNPLAYGYDCKVDEMRKSLVGIDCNAAGDGPYYYVSKYTGRIISRVVDIA